MTPVKFDLEQFVKQSGMIHDAQEALSSNSSFLAFYGTQEALWDGVVSMYKQQLEVTEALKAQDIRASSDKVAQGVVDARVAIDDEVQAVKKKLRLAKEQSDLYTNACRAFVDRGNNARSMSSREKSEISQAAGSYNTGLDKEEARDRLKNLGKSAII